MSQWTYQGRDNVEPESWATGFVYLIETWSKGDMSDKRIYIGKKSLTSSRRKKIGVRAKKATKTRKSYETIVKDSGWRSYTGSCKELNAWIAEHPHTYNKRILEWSFSKKNLHYLELKYQFRYQVIETNSWNDNLGGRIWRRDTDRQLHEEWKEIQRNRPKKPRQKKEICL